MPVVLGRSVSCNECLCKVIDEIDDDIRISGRQGFVPEDRELGMD